MIISGMCIFFLLVALFFLLKNLNQILMIVKETFEALKECQKCVREIVEDNRQMMVMLKEFFNFEREKWPINEMPPIIKAHRNTGRTLSEEHKRKIAEANKKRSKNKRASASTETPIESTD